MWQPFTEQHQHFRKMVRSFVEKELAPHIDEWEKDELFPNWVFKRAGELGIHGAHYAEEHGGAGGDYWFSVAKSEEYCRVGGAGVGMGLLVQSDMATPVIADVGTTQQVDEFLVPALRGDKIAALGVSEPGAGSDVAGIRTHAKRDGDDYLISGQKTFITNGTRADFVTMLTKTRPEAGAQGCSFFLVPTDLPGFTVAKKLEKIGNKSSDTAELFLEDVRVPKAYLLGEEGQGFMYLMQSFQSERLIAGTTALAGARRVLEFSKQYGQDRVAFGKPIMKRELWRHRFVDMHIQEESARAFAYKCVDAYNHDKYERDDKTVSMETVRLISMLKVLVGDVADQIMDTCLQFHGGWGYIEDYPIARAWRDQRLIRIGGGTSETMKYYIAKLMGF
ncbi:MAG: acyl-CoA dehydrogenase family protein [Myxococcota bacterium]